MPPNSRKRKSKDESEEPVLSKRSKANGNGSDAKPEKPEMQEDGDGNIYWELSSKRRMTIQEFKGKTLVSLREFYEKDGKLLPGKSGLNLTPEQLTAFVMALPGLTAALEEKGVSIPRPNYDGGDSAELEKETKRNFDATSDEED